MLSAQVSSSLKLACWLLVAEFEVGELFPNTDWQNKNRFLESLKEKAVGCISVYMFDHLVLSSAFLNSDLLATNGATLGACIDLSNWALT